MPELVAYKRMPVWNKETVPTEITHKHNTKVGTWGKIKVLKGQIKFEAISDDNEITDTFIFDRRLDIPMVEPQAWHRVTLLTDDTEFFVEFFCQPEDYFAKNTIMDGRIRKSSRPWKWSRHLARYWTWGVDKVATPSILLKKALM